MQTIRFKMSPRQLVGYCVIFVSCVLIALLIFPSSSDDLDHPNTQVKHKSRFEIKKGLEHGLAFVLFYRHGDHYSKSLMKSWSKMAHDVHLKDKKIQVTKLDCKKRKYERYCHDELHLSTFPTLAWMKDGKIQKTYASHKFNVDLLNHFVFENLHGANVAVTTHKPHQFGYHPKVIRHNAHKPHHAVLNEAHNPLKSHQNHHDTHRHEGKDSSSSSYESNSQAHGKHHLVPVKKTDHHHKLTSAEHGVLSKMLKKAFTHHSDEHHVDPHNHMQNDQHHIEQIAKIHEHSLVNHKRVVRKNQAQPAHGKAPSYQLSDVNQHQIPAPKFPEKKQPKPLHDPNNANEKRAKKHDEARIFKNHPKKPHHIPHPLRPHHKSKTKPSKSHPVKVMQLNSHNFNSSLSATGITFVIFYGAKTKNPASNKRVAFIKHVAQRYVKNQHSMGEVNCKLEANAALCKREKFVIDPMVNIYKKGVLLRHNYQFVQKSNTTKKHPKKKIAAVTAKPKLPSA